jgi:uncharacterized protein YcgL (UPF0745 family)
MQVHLYTAAGGQYLHVPEKNNFAKVPDGVLTKLGELRSLRYLKSYKLAGSLIGVDVAKATQDIGTNGYHITHTEVR